MTDSSPKNFEQADERLRANAQRLKERMEERSGAAVKMVVEAGRAHFEDGPGLTEIDLPLEAVYRLTDFQIGVLVEAYALQRASRLN